jgi:uncharacterized integral membrane protein
MVASSLVLVLRNLLSQLVRTVLSLLLALLLLLYAMRQVNQPSSTSAKAMSASASLLPSASQVFATQSLLVQR